MPCHSTAMSVHDVGTVDFPKLMVPGAAAQQARQAPNIGSYRLTAIVPGQSFLGYMKETLYQALKLSALFRAPRSSCSA